MMHPSLLNTQHLAQFSELKTSTSANRERVSRFPTKERINQMGHLKIMNDFRSLLRLAVKIQKIIFDHRT